MKTLAKIPPPQLLITPNPSADTMHMSIVSMLTQHQEHLSDHVIS